MKKIKLEFIFQVVITKLQSSTAAEHDHQHMKAAKVKKNALRFVILHRDMQEIKNDLD